MPMPTRAPRAHRANLRRRSSLKTHAFNKATMQTCLRPTAPAEQKRLLWHRPMVWSATTSWTDGLSTSTSTHRRRTAEWAWRYPHALRAAFAVGGLRLSVVLARRYGCL
jgi:hypothetical protein